MNPGTTLDLLGLLVAALGGTAVGLERQWSGHAAGPQRRFAGIRTFTMLGGLGGLTGGLWTLGLTGPAVVLLTGLVGTIVAAYVAASRREIDSTTEVAALVVVAAGVLSGVGAYRVASAIVALTSLLLVEKSRLHALVARIDDVGLRAAVRFSVMALVVLPVLPVGPFGPLEGVRPRELWALVLFFSGLRFVGFLARRIVGPGHGYLMTGFLGGLVSSTSVTLNFARLSRTDHRTTRALAFGAVAANAMLYPRVLVATAVLNRSLLPAVSGYLLFPALVGAAVALAGIRQSPTDAAAVPQAHNPLQLAAALQMALTFLVVMMIVGLAGDWWGQAGVLGSAAVLGFTDVDALTVSMAKSGASSVSAHTASLAIAVGVLSNTVLKLVVATVVGAGQFRTIAGGALLLMLAAGCTALIVWS